MNALKLLSTSSIVLGVSFVLRFALTVTLAKYLTSSELGVYSWAVTAFGIAGIVTNFGLDFFLIRKVPEYRDISLGMVSAVIKNTQKQSIKIAFVLILIIFSLSYFSIYIFEGAAIYRNELMLIIFALPFAAISLIYSTSLRAFDFPLKGQFIESIIQTGFLLIVILIFSNIFIDLIPTNKRTIAFVCIFFLSWVFSSLISFFFFKKSVTLIPPLPPS